MAKNINYQGAIYTNNRNLPSGRTTSARTERRKAARKAATAERKQRIRERIAANKRLVRA